VKALAVACNALREPRLIDRNLASAQALDLLGDDARGDADRLRADLFWRPSNGQEAVKALSRLARTAGADGKLDKDGSQLVLNWASALTLAGHAALDGHRRGFLRFLPFFGPAFVASVAYIDPGNFAPNIQAGSQFGYQLLWSIVMANVIAMIVQSLSAKLGIATYRIALGGFLIALLAAILTLVNASVDRANMWPWLAGLYTVLGVLAALLLNHVVLAPGEAMYLPAGNLHTYLRGTGVEISANSDNVLRGGLTAKHIDVPELLRVLDFSYGELPVHSGERVGPQETVYRTPAEEFQLARLEWARGESTPVLLCSSWPQILLCTQGSAQLRAPDGASVTLCRGGSVWMAAADPEVIVCPGAGPVQLFRALPGLAE